MENFIWNFDIFMVLISLYLKLYSDLSFLDMYCFSFDGSAPDLEEKDIFTTDGVVRRTARDNR